MSREGLGYGFAGALAEDDAGEDTEGANLFSQEFGAFVAQELSDGCWIVFIKSHLLEVGQHCTPLFLGG